MGSDIGGHLLHLYQRELLKYLNSDQETDIDEGNEAAAEKLRQCGISRHHIKAVQAVFRGLVPRLQVKGILNPRVLRRDFDRRLWFYFVEAQRGQYRLLEEYIASLDVPNSIFVIFGLRDVVFSVYTTEDVADALRNYLTQYGYYPHRVEIVDTLLYHGIAVPELKLERRDINPEELNALIEDYTSNEKTREVFQEGRVLLGRHYVEDYEKTRRLKAVIEISVFRDDMEQIRDSLPNYLLGINGLTPCFRSFHKCKEQCAFITEVICDDTYELATLVRAVRDVVKEHAAKGEIETRTYIASWGRERLPWYLPQKETAILRLTTTKDDPRIVMVKEKYIAPLPKNLQLQYVELDQYSTLVLLQALGELDAYDRCWMTREAGAALDCALSALCEGFLGGSLKKIADSITSMSGILEALLRLAVENLVLTLYEDLSVGFERLGLRGRSLNQYSLGDQIGALSKISARQEYRKIGLAPNEDLLTRLASFKVMRNRTVHNVLPEAWKSNAIRAVLDAREAFRDALFSTDWIQRNLLHWAPIEILDEPPPVSEEYLKQIGDFKRRRYSLLAKVKSSVESKQATDVLRTVKELNSLASVKKRIVDVWREFSDNLDEVLDQIGNKSEKTSLKKLVSFLEENEANAPAQLFADCLVFGLLIVNPRHYSVMNGKISSWLH